MLCLYNGIHSKNIFRMFQCIRLICVKTGRLTFFFMTFNNEMNQDVRTVFNMREWRSLDTNLLS